MGPRRPDRPKFPEQAAPRHADARSEEVPHSRGAVALRHTGVHGQERIRAARPPPVVPRHAVHEGRRRQSLPGRPEDAAQRAHSGGVTITDAEFEHMVLRGIPDWLAAYASQLLGNAILNGKSPALPDIIHILSGEADHVKTRNASKEQPQTKGKKVAQTPDEALAATGTSEGDNARHRKGKCHHCGKEGHRARECRTKKREEAAAAAAANSSGQSAQASRVTKPENRPVGSTNAVFNDDSDGNGNGFWFVGEDVAHVYPYFAEPDPDPLMSDDNDEEPFHAETCCVEDENAFDWVGFDDRLIKEREEWDIDEEAGPVTTQLVGDAPHSESTPVPHNALHAPAPSYTPAALGAPDEEDRIVSPRGELVTDRIGWTLLERVR